MTIWLLDANEGGWICDRFNYEYKNYEKTAQIIQFPLKYYNLDKVWIIPDWCSDQLFNQINGLHKMKVLVSCHHFVPEKITQSEIEKYKKIDSFTTKFHVPCENTKNQLIQLFNIDSNKIVVQPFWVNNNIFFPMENKKQLRDELHLPQDKFLVFSSVRDTEGSSIGTELVKPKKEKGPQHLVEIVRDMKSSYNVEVVLGGWRRQYVKQEFDRYGINYHSRDSKTVEEIMSFDLLNKYYNACDLVINPAEIEGGPMSVPEAAATKTPIISSNTGIASVMLSPLVIYPDPEMPEWENCLENALKSEVIEYNYKTVSEYFTSNGKGFEFFDKLLETL